MTQPPGGYPPPDPGRHEPAWQRDQPTWHGDQPAWQRDQPAWQRDQPTWHGGPASGGPAPVPHYPSDYPSAGAPPYQPPGLGPPGDPPGPPPYPAGPPPRRRRRMLLLGAAVLAGVLVLCAAGGVGAWLLTRDPDRNGADSPSAAVRSFLEAVYRDLDPAAAASVVCSEARDQDALATKIDEIRAYEDTARNPTFSWDDPSVVEEGEQLAVVSVTVTMTTDDEKTSEQNLRVSVLDKDANGWWVCDVETVQDEPSPQESPPAGEDAGTGGDGDG